MERLKNCLELSAITMEIAPGKGNGLNSILQDEFQAVDETIRYLKRTARRRMKPG